METTNTNRLEAFSDGVLAIIITIMVLEFHPPSGVTFRDLLSLFPSFLSYLLSFVFLAIYWNNHHHLLKTIRGISPQIMWANMNLLFWLSLTPFTTNWMGKQYTSIIPTACYGVTLLMAAIAYYILQKSITKHLGPNSAFVKAIGNDYKSKLSIALYITAIILVFVNPFLAHIIYVVVAITWIVPDRRLESVINFK